VDELKETIQRRTKTLQPCPVCDSLVIAMFISGMGVQIVPHLRALTPDEWTLCAGSRKFNFSILVQGGVDEQGTRNFSGREPAERAG
jgi:hypothetical protein